MMLLKINKTEVDIHWIPSSNHCTKHLVGGCVCAGRHNGLVLFSHAVKQVGCDLT